MIYGLFRELYTFYTITTEIESVGKMWDLDCEEVIDEY